MPAKFSTVKMRREGKGIVIEVDSVMHQVLVMFHKGDQKWVGVAELSK